MTWHTDLLECVLCHVKDYGVKPRLTRWKESPEHPPGMLYEHVDRCMDDAACRARVEADRRTWPVQERVA